MNFLNNPTERFHQRTEDICRILQKLRPLRADRQIRENGRINEDVDIGVHGKI